MILVLAGDGRSWRSSSSAGLLKAPGPVYPFHFLVVLRLWLLLCVTLKLFLTRFFPFLLRCSPLRGFSWTLQTFHIGVNLWGHWISIFCINCFIFPLRAPFVHQLFIHPDKSICFPFTGCCRLCLGPKHNQLNTTASITDQPGFIPWTKKNDCTGPGLSCFAFFSWVFIWASWLCLTGALLLPAHFLILKFYVRSLSVCFESLFVHQ